MEKITSQHDELQNLYFSPNTVRTVHTERIKCWGGGFMACREKQEIPTAFCPVIFEQRNHLGNIGINFSKLRLILA
jgi:hypothetical protein